MSTHTCEKCGREFDSQTGLNIHKGKFHTEPYHDEETLRNLYWNKGLSTPEIAEKYDCKPGTIHKWLVRNDIETRLDGGADPDADYRNEDVLRELYTNQKYSIQEVADEIEAEYATVWKWLDKYDLLEERRRSLPALLTNMGGYEEVHTKAVTSFEDCAKVHTLTAIAHGADPSKLYSGGKWHVHHKNGIAWDNRPENLEVMRGGEHSRMHSIEQNQPQDPDTGRFVSGE
jgi:transposase